VLPVNQLDNKTHHIVIAHTVLSLMLMVSAKTVNTIVILVNTISITVPSVLPTELKSHTVLAQKDTMMMDIIQNVKSVESSVSPVPTVLVVIPVNLTEPKNHQFVHVQKDSMNVVNTTKCVVNVLTNVSPVPETKITVISVLKTEETLHHNVHVKTIILKSTTFASNVISLDVKPVAITIQNTVVSVNQTD
jgi:hypothetical protein